MDWTIDSMKAAYEEAKKEMQECIDNDDTESAHKNADEALVKFLVAMEFTELASMYEAVEKWYA